MDADAPKRLEDMTEPELREVMTQLGKTVEFVALTLGCEKPLFALLLFNDPALAQYVGNCERQDMIRAFREAADRLESRGEVARVPFPKRKGGRS